MIIALQCCGGLCHISVPISHHFSSVAELCPTLCNPMNCSMPGLPVHHQLPEFTQTHVHQVGDAIRPSYPLSSPSPPAPNPSQHQDLFQWVSSSHEVIIVYLSSSSVAFPLSCPIFHPLNCHRAPSWAPCVTSSFLLFICFTLDGVCECVCVRVCARPYI